VPFGPRAAHIVQLFEALSECDWFGGSSEDPPAIVLLRQQANQCVRLLRKLGLSQVGAVYEVRKFPWLCVRCRNLSRSGGNGLATLDIVSVASDIAGAGTALAGLILVYL